MGLYHFIISTGSAEYPGPACVACCPVMCSEAYMPERPCTACMSQYCTRTSISDVLHGNRDFITVAHRHVHFLKVIASEIVKFTLNKKVRFFFLHAILYPSSNPSLFWNNELILPYPFPLYSPTPIEIIS